MSDGTYRDSHGTCKHLSRTSRRDRTGHHPTKGVRMSRCPSFGEEKENQLILTARVLASTAIADRRSLRKPRQASQPQAYAALSRSPATHGRLAQTRTSDSRKPAGEAGSSPNHLCGEQRPRVTIAAMLQRFPSRHGAHAGDLGSPWEADRLLGARVLMAYPRIKEDPRPPPCACARAMAGEAWPMVAPPPACPGLGTRGGGGVASKRPSPGNRYLLPISRGLFLRNRPNKLGCLKFWAPGFSKIWNFGGGHDRSG